MTFTVTPQPDNIPPRVRIDVNSDDSAKPFTSLTIKRDGKSLREQPFVGSSSAVLFDYEAPFGVATSYSADASIAEYVSVYATSWANLTGWSTSGDAPSVSGGKFLTASGTTARAERLLASITNGRMVLSAPLEGASYASFVTGDGRLLKIERLSAASSTHQIYYGGTTQNLTPGSGPIVLAFDAAGVMVTSGSTRLYVATGGAVTSGTYLVARVNSSLGRVPGLSVDQYGTSTPFAATATTTLNVTETWLIHPSKPSLSVPIYSHGGQAGVRWIEASSGESRSSQAVSTVHRPVGRRRAVVITSGPRQADEWTLVVESETIAAKNSLRAIVDDQTPLLLRSPASALMDLPDDWYSVGDVTVTRVEVPVITQVTTITMPLTPVDEPIVRVGALWTWGDVLTTYSTWQQVLDANDTWLDVLAGPQP